MQIGKVEFSYPYIRYLISIKHQTIWKANAFEWLIMQIVAKSKLDDYKDVPLVSILQEIFAIDASCAESLIKPILITLEDKGIITMIGISDESKLSTVLMQDLSLTDFGYQLVQNQIPQNIKSEDRINLYYDIYQKVITNSLRYGKVSNGIQVVELSNANDIVFPLSKIRDWLNKQIGKQTTALSWLTPDTNIKDIAPVRCDLVWNNRVLDINITKGLIWHVADSSNYIDEMSLQKFDFSSRYSTDDLSISNIKDLDSETKRVLPMSNLPILIKESFNIIPEYPVFLINKKYCTEDILETFSSRAESRLLITVNENKLSAKVSPQHLTITIPMSVANTIVFISKATLIKAEIFPISAGNIKRNVALAYIKMNRGKINFEDTVLTIVQRYVETVPEMLLILAELKKFDLLLEYVKKMLTSKKSFSSKVGLIANINMISKNYNDKQLLSFTNRETLEANLVEVNKQF